MGKIFKKRSFILADSDVWVLDRNYNRTIALKWKQVQTVVYLGLLFHVVLFRMIKRCLMRGLTREVLWVDNTETVWRHFFTLDSMILWTIKRFHRNRRRYTALFKKSEYAHIHFVRLRSKEEVTTFLASFSGVAEREDNNICLSADV